jgi:hypothetical protein
MNYLQLRQTIVDLAARPSLANVTIGPDLAPVRFVRSAEGMIRRELRAFPLNLTLQESDRASAGIYTLPSTVSELRAIYGADAQGNSFALDRVSPLELREQLDASAPPVQYSVLGDTIEFRGTPTTNATFELRCLGHPAPLVNDNDTNSLLTDHEAIYLYGALYALYTYTQDLELAQKSYDTFSDAVDKLNEQLALRISGARTQQQYDFSPSGSY